MLFGGGTKNLDKTGGPPKSLPWEQMLWNIFGKSPPPHFCHHIHDVSSSPLIRTVILTWQLDNEMKRTYSWKRNPNFVIGSTKIYRKALLYAVLLSTILDYNFRLDFNLKSIALCHLPRSFVLLPSFVLEFI